jgi:hypothetical protein
MVVMYVLFVMVEIKNVKKEKNAILATTNIDS